MVGEGVEGKANDRAEASDAMIEVEQWRLKEGRGGGQWQARQSQAEEGRLLAGGRWQDGGNQR